MAGGTQNRNAKVALEIHNLVIGQKKLCKCPIHRKNEIGTEIDATLFNRQKTSQDGLQGMCANGKKFLDSIKHKINSWKIIFIHDKITNSDYLNKMKTKSVCEKTFNFYGLCIEVFEKEYKMLSTIENISLKYFKFMSGIDEMVGNGTLTEKYKLYNSNIDEKDCNQIKIDADPYTTLTQEEIKSVLSLQDKYCNLHNLYCIESSDKTLHHHSKFNTGLGKIGFMYNQDGAPYEIDGIHIRLHKFNTFKTTSSEARVESYFPDGNYKLANSEMKKINKTGLSADHIWPISLGGKHDISNIEPMPLLENIKKRNNLSIELINRTKNNISNYLSERYQKTFNIICTNNIITNEIVIELERTLKYEVEKWRENISNMDVEEKRDFITNFLVEHNMSIKKNNEIIKDYFTLI
jgi:hypothetical protein